MTEDVQIQAMRERNRGRQQEIDGLLEQWGEVWSSGASIDQMSKRAAGISAQQNALIWSMEQPPDWDARLSPQQLELRDSSMRRTDDLVTQIKAIDLGQPGGQKAFESLNEELWRVSQSISHLFFY